MGKYRRLTKRRRQRAGAVFDIPSFKDLVPSGFPTSLTDLKNIVTETVEKVPALKTVSGAVGKISDVSTTLTTVSSTITNLPDVIKTNVTGVVDAQLAKAGIPPIGTGSGPVDSGNTEPNNPNNTDPNNPNNTAANNTATNNTATNNTATNNTAANNTANENTDPSNSENANAAGGGRRGGPTEYELVTLSRPVSDPLFVCFKSGKAVYFTRGAKGVRILTNGNVGQKTKRQRR